MTLHRDPAAASRPGEGDEGFTLVELVVAIGLIAFVFAAVAGILTSSLKALAIQKARTQGNEVATQAIEDLQRRSFDYLVLCTPPTGPAPAGLDDTVLGAGCPADTTGYGEDPCNNINPTDAPKAEYSCTRIAVTYNVKRFISWVDDGHTSKRLAVFVKWTDNVGVHTVSQQSSLRAPTAASIIGLANPTLSNPFVTDPNSISAAGDLSSAVTFRVSATSLSATDRVFVTFWDRDADGALVVDSIPLTAKDASAAVWETTVSSGFSLGYGSQFFTFNAVRARDGKSTAILSPAAHFCVAADPTCAATDLPFFTAGKITAPATVALNAAGGTTADFTVSAETQNVSPAGRVQVLLPTLGGVQAVDMAPSATACTYNKCTWSVTIAKARGYAFASGANKFDFAAFQPYVAASTTDKGSTASAQSSVTFG